MALTNAERQANLKARRENMSQMLAEQNAALQSENVALRTELETLRAKVHRLELAALRLQIKAQKPAEVAAVKNQPQGKGDRSESNRLVARAGRVARPCGRGLWPLVAYGPCRRDFECLRHRDLHQVGRTLLDALGRFFSSAR